MKIVPPTEFLPKIPELLGPGFIEFLRKLGVIAESSGIELYLIGGAVRDLLLGRCPEDLDLFGTHAAIPLAEKLIESWHLLPSGTPAIGNYNFHPDIGLAKLYFSDPIFQGCHRIDILGEDTTFLPRALYDPKRLKEFPFLARISSAYASAGSLAVALSPKNFGTL